MKTFLVKVRSAGHLFVYDAIAASSWDALESANDQFGLCAVTVTAQ